MMIMTMMMIMIIIIMIIRIILRIIIVVTAILMNWVIWIKMTKNVRTSVIESFNQWWTQEHTSILETSILET